MAASAYPPDDHVLRDLRFWTERDAAGARSHLEVTPELLGASGSAHAGVLATLVDMSGGEGAIRAVAPDWVATSDLVLHVTRRVTEGVVVAVPCLLCRTRSTAVIEVALRVGDDPVGLSTVTFAVLPGRPGAQRMGVGASEPRTDFALPGSRLSGPLRDVLAVRENAPGELELSITPYVGNSLNALQGGVAATLLEWSAVSRCRSVLGDRARVLDLAVNYLRLLRVGPARTRARVLRQGRDEMLVRIELLDAGDEDRLCTVATALLGSDAGEGRAA